jgi:hypothetical protein
MMASHHVQVQDSCQHSEQAFLHHPARLSPSPCPRDIPDITGRANAIAFVIKSFYGKDQI